MCLKNLLEAVHVLFCSIKFCFFQVIPDALTTMSQYLDRLEQGFAANGMVFCVGSIEHVRE